MTGEDMIIEAAAAVLVSPTESRLQALRVAFRIAGRCEHCGTPIDEEYAKDFASCVRCGAPTEKRSRQP